MSNLPPDFCPYVGLAPFESKHQDYYFGRNQDAATLADNVIASPLTVLYGSSGTGKTSLINVGLPRAIMHLHRDVHIVSFRNWQGEDFLVSLVNEIVGAIAGDALHGLNGPSLYEALQWKAHQMERLIVLVLDQFEEYFVYEHSQETGAKLESELAKTVRDRELRVHVLISIRDDRYHLLDRLKIRIPEILKNTLELEHLTENAVREAITEPINVYNKEYREKASPIVVKEAFVNRLIAELKEVRAGLGRASGRPDEEQAIELPYLQLAMEKIWCAAGGSNAMCFDEALLTERSVKQITSDHLDEVMSSLNDEERQICADIFDRLVTRSGAKFAMTAYDLDFYAPGDEEDVAKVLRKLADNSSRILKTVPTSGNKPAFEIFHDVLGPPLLCWQERYQTENRSKAEHEKLEREAKKSRDRARLYKRATVAVSLLLIAAVFAGLFALKQWQRAETSERRAKVSMLWNTISSWAGEDLNSFEIKTLWELATSNEPLRNDFINHLNRDPSSLARLGMRANPIARAIGLKWPSEAISAVRERFNTIVSDRRAAQVPTGFRFIARVRGLAAFKDQLDPVTYKNAVATVEKELQRITEQPSVEPFDLITASASLAVLDNQLSPSILAATKEQIRKGIKERVSNNNRDKWESIAVAQSVITAGQVLNKQELSETLVYLSRRLMENRDSRNRQTIARAITVSAPFADPKIMPESIVNLVNTLSMIRNDGQDLSARLPILEAIEVLTDAWFPALSSSIEPALKEILDLFENASTPVSNKALIARATIFILSRLPPDHANPYSQEQVKFILPGIDDATAGRIAAAIFSASKSMDHAPLSPDDLSALTTALEQSVDQVSSPAGTTKLPEITDSEMLESSFVVKPANLTGAQARLLGLVVPSLTPDQTKRTFETAIKICRATNDPVVREALAEAVGALAPKMDEAVRIKALHFAKYQLASSGSIDEAAAWAGLIATLFESEANDEAYIKAVIDVLKYPTSAGRPTEVLLKHFHDHLLPHFSDVPTPIEGPWLAVAWIEKNFRDMEPLLRKPAEFPKE